ncbi:hypothetical protein GCM10009087_03220 [Sphingomonas oligophenolica]|uniref:Uncharacterized protein n=1 Tax=Sphingomonas oligophenolica TaxID=301154 RepID=A0ABU9Y0K0_9SPHN
MRKTHIGLLAGIASLALAGSAMAATAKNHVLNIALPDGSIEQIHYSGDVAPRVAIAPPREIALPVAFAPFEMAPFADFDRIAAAMDRQMDAMMRQASTMAALPVSPDGRIDTAAFGKMPAGTVQYSFVSTSSGKGMCSRSVQVTSFGPNQQPKMVSQSSGDCSAMGVQPTPASGTPAAAGKTIPVKQDAAPPAPKGPTI